MYILRLSLKQGMGESGNPGIGELSNWTKIQFKIYNNYCNMV